MTSILARNCAAESCTRLGGESKAQGQIRNLFLLLDLGAAQRLAVGANRRSAQQAKRFRTRLIAKWPSDRGADTAMPIGPMTQPARQHLARRASSQTQHSHIIPPLPRDAPPRRIQKTLAGVAELVDALDSKSSSGNRVWVRFPPPAPSLGVTFIPVGNSAIDRNEFRAYAALRRFPYLASLSHSLTRLCSSVPSLPCLRSWYSARLRLSIIRFLSRQDRKRIRSLLNVDIG